MVEEGGVSDVDELIVLSMDDNNDGFTPSVVVVTVNGVDGIEFGSMSMSL